MLTVAISMSVTKKSIVMALILALIACILWYFSIVLMKKEVVVNKNYPTFVALDTESTIYDINGNVSRTLVATKTTYFNDKNYYIFENPLITAYDYKKDQVNIWHLKGKYGDLKNNEIAFVKDDVLIYPGFTGSQHKKAVADYLYYDINKNLVTSKSTVTIYGQGIKTTGTDFSLDLNKNVMSYKGQPNATYYPNSK